MAPCTRIVKPILSRNLPTHTLSHRTDLYYTRVTPSNQFDLLAEDFDYTLISAVVVGMFVATLVLSRLSAKKMLKSLWK